MSKKYKINKEEMSRVEKRKIELRRRKQKRTKLMMAASFILIVIIGMVIVYSVFSNPNEDILNDEKNKTPTNQSNITTGSQISIPLADIDNNAKFYSYDVDDVEIKYFALTGSDGKVHVALDACDVCYGSKKGYVQVGDIMRCVNCGNQYPINSLGTENTAGGCWPSYMPMIIEDDNILIEKSDLENKRYMFI